MRKSLSKPALGKSQAFTLLELLVVIAIIGILAGIMFPATTAVLRKAENTHAESTAYNLKNAISAYYTEYRKYPVQGGTSEDTPILTDNDLMDVLLGSDTAAEVNGLNPRRINFFTTKAAKPMGGGKFRKGVTLDENGGGKLWDPWGEQYYVLMDLDYNNRITKPTWDTKTPSAVLPETILVWSTGREIDDDSDNIKTW